MHTSTGRPAAAPRGFTLLDLAGVLAITGALGAIMFPVFGQVRQKASQSFCMAGRSQFIRATATYAEDYDEAWVRNPSSLKPYVRAAVYACPTENWAGPPRFCLTREADEMRRRDGGGHGAGGGGGHHSSDLLYHTGGTVMNNGAFAQAIFWGPSWSSTSFAGDKMTGIDSFFSGVGGSAYLATTTEYGEPTANPVKNAVTTAGHLLDTSGASGGGSTSAILAEVCKEIKSPVSNGFYAVYTDLPRGSAGYCAWHSAGSCGGVPIQFAFFWDLDGDLGCDPGDSFTTHSQGLSALANVTGHELSETLTDPRLNAWFDRSGAENGDKCAWTFNGPEAFGKNGTTWYIQGNWSNAAHAAGTSYLGPNSGCINGN